MKLIKKINSLLLETNRNILLKREYYGIDKFSNYSFSQMGEDRILSVIFNDIKRGFYVDVGAFHPKLYSNTYSFYLKGWRGINIDANKKNIELFNKTRPKDINLGIAVSNKKSKTNYYIFSNPAVNTISKDFADKISLRGEHKIIKTELIKTEPLSKILDEHLPRNKKIDFLNVDTEGYDLKVLESNNWKKYIPNAILIEDTEFDFDNMRISKIYRFLLEKGYNLKAKTNETLIFIRKY